MFLCTWLILFRCSYFLACLKPGPSINRIAVYRKTTYKGPNKQPRAYSCVGGGRVFWIYRDILWKLWKPSESSGIRILQNRRLWSFLWMSTSYDLPFDFFTSESEIQNPSQSADLVIHVSKGCPTISVPSIGAPMCLFFSPRNNNKSLIVYKDHH